MANTPDIKQTLAGLGRIMQMEVSLDNHHYIALSHLYRWMQEVAGPAAHGVLLDYGCGGQPYRNFFSTRVERYIGADVVSAKGITLDLEFDPEQPLPLAASSIDTILSTQTLEHVADVHFYLTECNRLLKPEGTLILTAPMQWRHHEVPFDFLRFTRFGILKLLEAHGFETLDLSPSGGVYALLGQIFLNHLAEKRGMKRKFLFRQINRLCLWLDEKYRDYDDTLNWMCVARKAR
jgi:SAM-dependent methyltransferase